MTHASKTAHTEKAGATTVRVAARSGAGYRHCQSLVKGLDLLAAMNQSASGAVPIAELVRMTGIHRTTVKRLLETLLEEGYVQVEAETNAYRLTYLVQSLSVGFRDNLAIVDVAGPFVQALSESVVWPCGITTLEGDEMVVRMSTRSNSPLSFHPGMPGRRLPILTTSAGRAYLAYASAPERETLLAILAARTDSDGERARDEAFVRKLIESTREQGYGCNLGEWSVEPKFGGVSVPLRIGGRVIACLNTTFLVRPVQAKGSLQGFVEQLRETAKKIEAEFTSPRDRGARSQV